MTNSTLMAHAGAKLITRDALALIDPPEPTKSHKPVRHSEVIDNFAIVLADQGLPIIRETHAMTEDAMKLFSLLEIGDEHGAYRFAVAVRHANDKSMSLQAVAGTRCFICDNMALHGDYKVLRRKHTVGIDIPELVAAAVQKVLVSFQGIRRQLDAYENFVLADELAKLVIYDATIGEKLPGCPRNLAARVHSLYFDPIYPEFQGRNMLSLMNAFTSALKDVATTTQFSVSGKLPGFLGGYGPVIDIEAEAA